MLLNTFISFKTESFLEKTEFYDIISSKKLSF